MKNILIQRACGLKDEKQECDNIKTQADLYCLEIHNYCPKPYSSSFEFWF